MADDLGGGRRWRLVRANALAIPASVRRFNQRQRARRIRSARPWLIAAATVALVGAATFIVYGTSILGVSHIRVVGSGFIGKSAITNAADVTAGTPLASLNLTGIQAKVQALVGVRSAQVHRDWPSTLVIDVTPRTAVAAMPAGTSYRLIDAAGVVFRTVQGAPALPLLQVANPGPGDATTASALTVLVSLPASIRDQLVRITATSPAAVTLILQDKREVIWGDSSDNAAKGRVAVTLLARAGTVIDVSAPNVVTVR
jgi:cell division protein FtsQ